MGEFNFQRAGIDKPMITRSVMIVGGFIAAEKALGLTAYVDSGNPSPLSLAQIIAGTRFSIQVTETKPAIP